MNAPDLIRELQDGRIAVDSIAPRDFERVVAELLAGFGWRVSVTQATRDGGVDIFAISTDASGLDVTWIVECKRYAEENAVSVQLLRQLFGVKHHLGASNALLVTTSRFTRDADRFAEARHDVHRVDRRRLLDWIRDYRRAPSREPYTVGRTFRSCFLSHSTADAEFAAALNDELRQAGVRVWFAPENMKPGDKVFDQIRRAIAAADRLLLVLSEASIQSPWVHTEIREAWARERSEGRRVLFPLSLVPFATLREWEMFDSDTGMDLARQIREYFVLDFSEWRNSTKFRAQVRRLVEALQSDDAT